MATEMDRQVALRRWDRRTTRPCSSCGRRRSCRWAEDAWVCFGCGDEWNEDHDPIKYAPPGDTGPALDPLPPDIDRPLYRADAGFVYTDGGRAAAGFTGKHDAGDCVARAIAIAAALPYDEVYRALANLNGEAGGARTARDGVPRKVYDRYLLDVLGWTWTPTMRIGQGTTVHLRADELPAGRLVVRLSKHLCAVIDGVVHDNHDPRREGTRAVYGFWSEVAPA